MTLEKQVETSKLSKSESTLRFLVGLVLLVYALFLVYITLLSVYQDFEYPLLRSLWKTFFANETTTSTHEKDNGAGSEKEHLPVSWSEAVIKGGVHTFQMFLNNFNFLYAYLCSLTIFGLLGHPKSSRFFNAPLWKVVRKVVLAGFFIGAFNYMAYIAKGYVPLP